MLEYVVYKNTGDREKVRIIELYSVARFCHYLIDIFLATACFYR